MICMHKHASLLAATSHAAEVSELKQRLERTENELSEVKVGLQEKQEVNDDLLCVRKEYALYIDRSVVICAGATTEVEALKKPWVKPRGRLSSSKPPVKSSRPGSRRSRRSSRTR